MNRYQRGDADADPSPTISSLKPAFTWHVESSWKKSVTRHPAAPRTQTLRPGQGGVAQPPSRPARARGRVREGSSLHHRDHRVHFWPGMGLRPPAVPSPPVEAIRIMMDSKSKTQNPPVGRRPLPHCGCSAWARGRVWRGGNCGKWPDSCCNLSQIVLYADPNHLESRSTARFSHCHEICHRHQRSPRSRPGQP